MPRATRVARGTAAVRLRTWFTKRLAATEQGADDLRPGPTGHEVGLGVLVTALRPSSRPRDLHPDAISPRSGKTTILAIPITLVAVVLTSNKTEGWKGTAQLRAEQTGETVWTFDPQRIAHTP